LVALPAFEYKSLDFRLEAGHKADVSPFSLNIPDMMLTNI